MLMQLLWGLVEPLVRPVLEAIPEAPEPVSLTIPWPSFLPTWPVSVTLVAVVAVGTASLLVRLLRWGYGLIPVVQ